jgi:serine/threonine-protein kinase
MSAEKPRSSKRWVASSLAGVLMLLMGGGVVSWRCNPQPELQDSALAAESPPVREAPAPVEPAELQLPPRPDVGGTDAGSEVASESPVAPPEPDAAKPLFKGTGTLEVRVSPYATLFVDGKKVGLTPFKKPLELPAGPHTLEFHNDQLLSKPVIRHIDVRPGPNNMLKITLQEQ